MTPKLTEIQTQAGAIFSEDSTTPSSFGNDRQAFQAATEGVVLCDRSHWGIIEVTDSDRLTFLHNQTTNDIKSLQPGQGCDTIFVNSTARTIDLATIYLTENSALILISPGQSEKIMSWLDRYLFPMDRVKLANLSAQYNIFTLIGSSSNEILTKLNMEPIINQPNATHQLFQDIRVAVGSGLAIPGYTFIIPLDKASELWSKITDLGAIPMGENVWEKLRVTQGRPTPNQELTEDYNPLEAGLWQAISFTKGCYIGQETIARLNTYKGVKQKLRGIKLAAPVEPGTMITINGEKVGTLTSYAETPEGAFGLAYVRTKAGDVGLKVEVGNTTGELVDVPFLTHEYYQPEK
ncbi:MAG: folate-binding protein [Oscillatoria sp. PMC 1076.18]|nr:folate-binding protein [Oscillatoria sp. PMC 1076.18]